MTGGVLDAWNRPSRAVIDIGSNTVRLVIYAGPPRVPRAWLNESLAARLGSELAETGALPVKATANALETLQRYATLLADLGIDQVQTVATAAVRDASNGPDFLRAVEDLGLAPSLLSGEEEALGSARGVLGAFPDARGIVADLGGGSLELAGIADGACRAGISLPLGTLRLAAAGDARKLARTIERGLADSRDRLGSAQTLYLVGGTWRALASYAIHSGAYPLSDPHGFSLSADRARKIARQLAETAPAELAGITGVSTTRAGALPGAAQLLTALLEVLGPERLTASSWGLREGLLMAALPDAARASDPLLVEVADFAEPRGGSTRTARQIAEWGALSPPAPDLARLYQVSAQLALAAAHLEPNLRSRHVYEWAMDKRWAALDPAGRAWLAAALLASSGKTAPPAKLDRLAAWSAIEQATGWGLTVRLARRLGGGSGATLSRSRLSAREGRLQLALAPDRAHMVSAKVSDDLKTLAKWLGLKPEIMAADDPTMNEK